VDGDGVVTVHELDWFLNGSKEKPSLQKGRKKQSRKAAQSRRHCASQSTIEFSPYDVNFEGAEEDEPDDHFLDLASENGDAYDWQEENFPKRTSRRKKSMYADTTKNFPKCTSRRKKSMYADTTTASAQEIPYNDLDEHIPGTDSEEEFGECEDEDEFEDMEEGEVHGEMSGEEEFDEEEFEYMEEGEVHGEMSGEDDFDEEEFEEFSDEEFEELSESEGERES